MLECQGMVVKEGVQRCARISLGLRQVVETFRPSGGGAMKVVSALFQAIQPAFPPQEELLARDRGRGAELVFEPVLGQEPGAR